MTNYHCLLKIKKGISPPYVRETCQRWSDLENIRNIEINGQEIFSSSNAMFLATEEVKENVFVHRNIVPETSTRLKEVCKP